ncbi:MAG: hypothetical protein Q9210_001954 [Variospora velana]
MSINSLSERKLLVGHTSKISLLPVEEHHVTDPALLETLEALSKVSRARRERELEECRRQNAADYQLPPGARTPPLNRVGGLPSPLSSPPPGYTQPLPTHPPPSLHAQGSSALDPDESYATQVQREEEEEFRLLQSLPPYLGPPADPAFSDNPDDEQWPCLHHQSATFNSDINDQYPLHSQSEAVASGGVSAPLYSDMPLERPLHTPTEAVASQGASAHHHQPGLDQPSSVYQSSCVKPQASHSCQARRPQRSIITTRSKKPAHSRFFELDDSTRRARSTAFKFVPPRKSQSSTQATSPVSKPRNLSTTLSKSSGPTKSGVTKSGVTKSGNKKSRRSAKR